MDVLAYPLTSEIAEALALAARAHSGQTDKAGRPYMEHVEAVVANTNLLLNTVGTGMFGYHRVLVAAALHDTLEDTDITARDIADRFGWDIANGVKILTREPGMGYLKPYIEAITLHEWAKYVKVADLMHNMDLSRIARPTERDVERVLTRYAPALARLARAL